ncbi:MAG TPA: Uma2 family endonuclease [Gemmataceae bacterium]|nr:Uma2 family endonuclease [Gemmataceae bacterium]
MGETPLHADNLAYLVHMLRMWYERESQVFIAGNMFLYYVPGDRLKHLSPDVFVVHGVPKHTNPERRRYLVWEEGKVPDVVIELTSESTREEDIDDKMSIYCDPLGVKEYFLYDPYEEYMQPPLQGYRLIEGKYQPIEAVAGRLPSLALGLHLEPSEGFLRLYDPATQVWLPTPMEEHQARLQAETARLQAEAALHQEEEARRRAETEMQLLRQELEDLRRRLPE